jgi:hypothetical protein
MHAHKFELILERPPEPWQQTIISRYDDIRLTRARVLVHRPEQHLAAAIVTAARDLHAAGLEPIRVCAGDWVTLADVAASIGRSRETVRLWSIGHRGPGGFPPPLNPDRDTSFYSWSEIQRWLRGHGQRYIRNEPQLALVLANLALQIRHLATIGDHWDILHALLPPTIPPFSGSLVVSAGAAFTTQ